MRKPIDISGQRFGRLLVVEDSGERHNTEAVWACVCDCGCSAKVPGSRLRRGHTTSCGCYQRERRNGMGDRTRTHGKSKTPQYMMFYDARKRAKSLGLPFDIKPEDIVLPDTCPVLGIKLASHGHKDSRPSLDRIDPQKGYVTTNIRVISFRANRIKADATVEELRAVLGYVEQSCAT